MHDAHIRDRGGRSAQPIGLPALALDECDSDVRPCDREGQTRKARTAADVDQRGRAGDLRDDQPGDAVGEVAVDPLVQTLDRGQVLRLEGDPVEEGDEGRGDVGAEMDARRARARDEPFCGASGFT